MDISSYQEQFNSIFSDDSIDGYLEDPNLSVSDMIEKVRRRIDRVFIFI
jgi:hypothetical protein